MCTIRKEGIYRQLPIRNNHQCFGCSPINPHGLHMTFFTDGKALFSTVRVPEHLCGWRSMVHGGILSTILDETMGWSAIYLLKRLAMTKSLTVEFLKRVFIGHELHVEGRVIEVRNHREALVEGSICNEEGALCTRATGIFALFTPDTAIKRGIMDASLFQDLEFLREG